MTFPALELSMGGTYAFIITLNNQLHIRQVKPIYGRLFTVKDLGVYQLHEEYRYVLGKSEIYIFNQKGCNPLSLAALIDIKKMLGAKTELQIEDLAILVDKIRKVEVTKQLVQKLRSDPNNQVSDEDLLKMIEDGSLENTAEALANRSKPLDYKGLNVKTITWLNAYFREDVVSRFYLNMRMITDDKYKLPDSPSVKNIFPIQKTTGKKNIALIVVNNSRIEIDASARVEMDYDKGYYVLHTKDYGDFDIIEAKTRYKYGRQNIFMVMVDTGKAQNVTKAEPEKPESQGQTMPKIPISMSIGGNGKQ